jgi:nitroimidazol reductase NimA-like FMN-containing flavoprotein (pyridoxamine 5'-phosphate oxidase superfamily)
VTEELSEDVCRALLATAAIGRFVFTIGALPAVVPVAFAVDGDSVVCRTSATSRLARAADRGVIALQADDIDGATRSGWSVVGTGLAEIVREPSEVRRIAALVQPWVEGSHDVAIRLPLTVLTGRRVGRD